jgi:hypothetical protein
MRIFNGSLGRRFGLYFKYFDVMNAEIERSNS